MNGQVEERDPFYLANLKAELEATRDNLERAKRYHAEAQQPDPDDIQGFRRGAREHHWMITSMLLELEIEGLEWKIETEERRRHDNKQ